MATPRKKPEDKLKAGRPTLYSKALGARICDAIACTTKGLRRMCEDVAEFPTDETIHKWRNIHPEFSVLYAEAKKSQAENFAQEIIEICDNPMETSEEIQQARLRIDTRKWLASKLLPKAYGDRNITESTVTVIKHEDALKELA